MPQTGLAIQSYSLSSPYLLPVLAFNSLLSILAHVSLLLSPASLLLSLASLLLLPGSWLQDLPSCHQPRSYPLVYLSMLGDSMGVEGGQAPLVRDSVKESSKVEVTVILIVSVFCTLSVILHQGQQVSLAGTAPPEAVLAVVNQAFIL